MTFAGIAEKTIPCLAIDIGASKVEVGLVDGRGEVTRRARLEVPSNAERLFDAIIDLVRSTVADDEYGVVGVGCAGPMTKHGELVSPLNIHEWRDFPLRGRLHEVLTHDVFVDGDARALALAEGRFGGARGQNSYVSMVVSTGVGGAFVIDGRLLDGDSGNAGHIGHLNVIPDGRLCSCGGHGCLEAEASGWAIEDMTGQSARFATASVRHRCASLVGRAVGTLSSVLDFTHCYIAGSVALGFGDEFFDTANKSAHEVAMMRYNEHLEVKRSELGADGPLLGAAMVGWRGSER
ncbi:MAG: ROK family protein [Acidimicrobiales bacterium]